VRRFGAAVSGYCPTLACETVVVGNREYRRDLIESIVTGCVEIFEHRPIDFYLFAEMSLCELHLLRKRQCSREHHGPASDKPASDAVLAIRPSCCSSA
jgi:hypothetical protein